MADVDYDDERTANDWLSGQRERIEGYLASQGVSHGGVSARPAWFVAPYLSVWAVGSRARSGSTGWWAISGDVPTDYLSAHDASDARAAMLAFARNWQELADKMSRGLADTDVQVGAPEDWSTLAPLLASRAKTLKQFAEDDDVWA